MDDPPVLLDARVMLKHADLMLGHLRARARAWPENAIYCQDCIIALRSVTFLIQKALAHTSGFEAWYEGIRCELRADKDLKYLLEARNHVLKVGALKLMGSVEMTMTGPEFPPGIEIRGLTREGPDVWAKAQDGSEVPVDWRLVPGFRFKQHLKLGAIEGLPPPPEEELQDLLRAKIELMDAILRDAEERFDPHAFEKLPTQLAVSPELPP